jgi:hypothetical protein
MSAPPRVSDLGSFAPGTLGRMARPFLALVVVAAAFAWTSAVHAGPVPWCGSGEQTSDVPDAVSAFEWHMVYAMPSDGVDRFASYAPRFAGDAAGMSNWWLTQDSTRRPRFDLVDAPGCASEPYGRVDISFLRLPRASSEYSFREIVRDVRGAGFRSPDKGYLVYYDGTLHPGEEFGLCGQGGTDSEAFAYAVLYLQSCGQSFNDDVRTLIATHEMVHGLGAVDDAAPNVCNDGHVCDSPDDLMKSVFGPGDALSSLTLDVNRDDYYGHSGNWPDAQDSSLLYQLDTSLEPAPAIVNLTATSTDMLVRVDWAASVIQAGVRYRVYDGEGALIRDEPLSTLTTTGTIGQTLTWTVRASNPGGFLSAPATIRFKVGFGIVDAAGALVRDTVSPTQVRNLRASRSGKQVLLRWAAVADPIGLRGYRVSAPGVRTVVVRATTTKLGARGKTVTVAAVDEAGNVGPSATVRAPR